MSEVLKPRTNGSIIGQRSHCPEVPYHSTYYKPIGDLPYIRSEQGGLIICTELIYEYTISKLPIPIQKLQAEEGVG